MSLWVQRNSGDNTHAPNTDETRVPGTVLCAGTQRTLQAWAVATQADPSPSAAVCKVLTKAPSYLHAALKLE